MESKNLVICDGEEGYASALARYILKKEELAVQVQTCSDVSHVLSVQEKTDIYYLFISSSCPLKERKSIKAENVFILTGDGDSALSDKEIPVYKYQSGDKLLAELIRQCGLKEAENITFLKHTGKKRMKIIGVYSPVHRIGKTSYALRLGQRLAKEANVLYLNMETYGGIGGHFPEEGQTLTDVLYYAKQEKGNLGLFLTTVVGHKDRLDYVSPVRVSEDMKSVSGEEWSDLFEKIAKQSIYEILILDMDEGIRDIYSVFEILDELHMPVADGEAPQAKIKQFEEELMFLGRGDIQRKIIRKEMTL